MYIFWKKAFELGIRGGESGDNEIMVINEIRCLEAMDQDANTYKDKSNLGLP